MPPCHCLPRLACPAFVFVVACLGHAVLSQVSCNGPFLACPCVGLPWPLFVQSVDAWPARCPYHALALACPCPLCAHVRPGSCIALALSCLALRCISCSWPFCGALPLTAPSLFPFPRTSSHVLLIDALSCPARSLAWSVHLCMRMASRFLASHVHAPVLHLSALCLLIPGLVAPFPVPALSSALARHVIVRAHAVRFRSRPAHAHECPALVLALLCTWPFPPCHVSGRRLSAPCTPL